MSSIIEDNPIWKLLNSIYLPKGDTECSHELKMALRDLPFCTPEEIKRRDESLVIFISQLFKEKPHAIC